MAVVYYKIRCCQKTEKESAGKSETHKQGNCERCIKRPQDFSCALFALIGLGPVMLTVAVVQS